MPGPMPGALGSRDGPRVIGRTVRGEMNRIAALPTIDEKTAALGVFVADPTWKRLEPSLLPGRPLSLQVYYPRGSGPTIYVFHDSSYDVHRPAVH